jgi:hypothetical protein
MVDKINKNSKYSSRVFALLNENSEYFGGITNPKFGKVVWQ